MLFITFELFKLIKQYALTLYAVGSFIHGIDILEKNLYAP